MSNPDFFDITDEQINSYDFKDNVVIVTGGSSGIGLATCNLFSSRGAIVINADITAPPTTPPNTIFTQCDVTSWSSLVSLFESTISTHGRLDHIVANAGISPTSNHFTLQTDPATGKPLEPDSRCMDINLRGAINTASLGLHYLAKQQDPKGSVIITASGASYWYHTSTDYTLSKHALVGYMRGIVPQLYAAKSKIRLNLVAPNWTDTNIVPASLLTALKITPQPADAVAKSILMLAGEEKWFGCSIYSKDGRFKEMDRVLTKVAGNMMDPTVSMKNAEEGWEMLAGMVKGATGAEVDKQWKEKGI